MFERHKEDLCEDYARDNPLEEATSYCLEDIQNFLRIHGMSLADFNLPNTTHHRRVFVQRYDAVVESNKGTEMYGMLNGDQKVVVDRVIDSCSGNIREKLFFMDGPGGSGKTFVYITIMHMLRGMGKTVFPVALTGLAANLLEGGRTAHSRFKLPVPLNETSTSLIKAGDKNALALRGCDLFIWDEAPMAPGKALTVVDQLLRDVMQTSVPFGGKCFLFAGDFRHCLPVVPRGGQVAIVNETIKRIDLWPKMRQLRLKANMRADPCEQDFSNWLLELGEGKIRGIENYGPYSFEIPEHCIVGTDIVDEMFGDVISELDARRLQATAILTPCNDASLVLNNRIIDKISSSGREYKSVDAVECDDLAEAMNYPMEFVNNQAPSGMPPHILFLKKGTIIKLLRNLNSYIGLCNGTRLIVCEMHDNVIEADILMGCGKGNRVFIPRIICTTGDGDVTLPFKIRRRQFPIRPAFAMTINSAQGQTFDKIGLYLPVPVFGHGQIYVAFSRVRRFSDIKVQILDHSLQGCINGSWFTQNIVYKEIL